MNPLDTQKSLYDEVDIAIDQMNDRKIYLKFKQKAGGLSLSEGSPQKKRK
jgi:hypothetical protein